MALETVKEEIIRRIKITDEEWIIRSIQKLLNIPTDNIIAYTIEGKPLTRELFLREILDSSNEAKSGNYTTDEDLEEEMRSW